MIEEDKLPQPLINEVTDFENGYADQLLRNLEAEESLQEGPYRIEFSDDGSIMYTERKAEAQYWVNVIGLDAEKSPKKGVGTPKSLVVRPEVRYTMKNIDDVQKALDKKVRPAKYTVHTTYIDTADGTWTRGLTKTKFRLRSYPDDGGNYFETKRRMGDTVIKYRQEAHQTQPIPAGMVPVCEIQYTRIRYEKGAFEVTIDCDIHDVNNNKVPGYVVEVKMGRPPNWLLDLLPKEDKNWSKSRWALDLARKS